MAARQYEFDSHSLSARGGFHAAQNSAREAGKGTGRAYDEHSNFDPTHLRSPMSSRGIGNSGKRMQSPVVQADNFPSNGPPEYSYVKGDRTHYTPESEFNTHSSPAKTTQVARKIALDAAQALGRGFDVTSDFRLGFAKGSVGSGLVEIDEKNTVDLIAPGDIVISNVSADIKCDKGERMHYTSEVIPFEKNGETGGQNKLPNDIGISTLDCSTTICNYRARLIVVSLDVVPKMSYRFNTAAAIEGKMPLGLFNSMYSFTGPWQADQHATKALALDGWFIKLYSLQLTRTPLVLREEIRNAIPSMWEPKALASFIEKYGTHIITGVQIGGKDVIYVRQHQSSPSSVAEVQNLMHNMADRRFLGHSNGHVSKERPGKEKVTDAFSPTSTAARLNLPPSGSTLSKEEVEIFCRRRGGDDMVDSHQKWLTTVPAAPDVIAMTFVPISSLISGIPGNGYLSHAVNLYLRFKPHIEELQNFLEFQLPLQWSPSLAELALGPRRKEPVLPSLQFSLMGPKLFVNTTQVSVGRKPVTGVRLYLEGLKCNRLAIHLQHLSTLPRILQPHWDSHVSIGPAVWRAPEEQDIRWFEPVQWKGFSHISTAPIEYKETWVGDSNDAYVVTGAQLQVWDFGLKNVLYLKLLYSRVPKCSIRRTVWDSTPAISQKSGILSQLGFSGKQQQPAPPPFSPNSAIYTKGPKAQSLKLLKFVDMTEMKKGPQDMPGHWLVTGAKMDVDGGKISLRVKYSLLHY